MSESNPIINEDLESIVAEDLPWNELTNKTILVTGAGGFIGSYLVKSLLHANDTKDLCLKVCGLGRSSLTSYIRLHGYSSHPAFHFIRHDISNKENLSLPQTDCIIHAASQASPKFYGVDPVGTLLPNISGTLSLLEHARSQVGCSFLFISSGSVYGDHKGALSEFGEQDYGWLDPLNVRSCYAESKRMAETMCVAWAHQYGVDTRIVRLFHTYGPGISLDDGRVFSDFIADAVHCRGITIKSDGTTARSFCYVSDTIKGILTVLFAGKCSEAYNIGNPREKITVSRLAELIRDLFPDRIPSVDYDSVDRGNDYIPSPVKQSSPSIEKARLLGWTPSTGLSEGFRKSILSFIPDSES